LSQPLLGALGIALEEIGIMDALAGLELRPRAFPGSPESEGIPVRSIL
jgi:hypothetical protein